jgi:uncharacterized 2Fe-2S/4Fe-4S cluster protein (DUF4445 family)
MPTVTFLPARQSVQVESGAGLLEAAARAGVAISAPCGGEGACGECRVRVERGAVELLAHGCLGAEELGEGWALACGSRVTGDVTIRVPKTEAGEGRIVTEQSAHASGVGAGPAEAVVAKVALRVSAISTA